jgi:hypothetical protein
MRNLISLLPLLPSLSVAGALAQANLEVPQRGSVQSGVSIVSGWVCDAERVEVAFDGGDLIETAYGTTRQDTLNACGDDDNGFSLLWAYQLLGPGKHEVVAYADGVEFGRNSFSVTDISGGTFLRDVFAESRIQGFPDLMHDVILEWQEANQNFVIKQMLDSMDSYDTPGVWDATDALGNETLISWHLQPDEEDPTSAMLFALSVDGVEAGLSFELQNPVILVGMVTQDLAILITDPEVGTAYSAAYIVVFTGPRSGFMELIECEPAILCPGAVGKQWQLEKGFPMEEGTLAASESTEEQTTVFSNVEAFLQSNRDRLSTILRDQLGEPEEKPMQPGQ